ncbi:MAG: hypothetical protein HXX80_04110 [Nitrososphaerales archaeon]|nr:hypothetical protein [Nitrososphaerales archaeon]
MRAADLHIDLTDDPYRVIRLAKFLGFSMLGFDLRENYDIMGNVADACKQEKVGCIFRADMKVFKRLKALEENRTIYVAKNVNEAKLSKAPLYVLEAGREVEEVIRVKEFCARKPNANFLIEFDFAPLRIYNGLSLVNYLRSLLRLMRTCRKRRIVTIFSSGAENAGELVPPRILYKFYNILGGCIAYRDILYEIPYRELIERLDLGPKIVGGPR